MEEPKEKLTWREFKLMLGPSFKGTWLAYSVSAVLVLISAAALAAEPVIYGRIVDEIIGSSQSGLVGIFARALPLVGMWALAAFIGALAKHLSQTFSWKGSYHILTDFMRRSIENVLGWDPERFGRVSLGATAKRFDRAWDASWTMSARMLTDVLPTVVIFLVFVGVGFWLDWRMAIVTLGGVPILAILTLVAYRYADAKQDELNQAWDDTSRGFSETLQSILPVKAFAGENKVLTDSIKKAENVTRRQEALNWIWTFLEVGNNTVTLISRIAVVIVGLLLIEAGSLSVGTLVTFLGMVTNILAPFDYLLADVLRRINEIKSAFGSLQEEWFKPNYVVDKDHPRRLKNIQGNLEFDHVGVRYHGSNKEVLKDITLRVRAGTSLAIVGPSGSGKSTFVRLINRFLDPSSGKVLLDGHDLRDYKISDLRRAVGLVQQDTVLFNDSIFNNILFARPNASRPEVMAAAKKAQAHEFIQRLPNGYSTVIGERGARLSGGERQRIALARIFLADPPILVLDESTSALDSETEHKLQLALGSVMQNRTTIVIAHRLSTVYLADQIAVIDKGQLIELGNHTDLIREGGIYERLWRLQSGGYLPD